MSFKIELAMPADIPRLVDLLLAWAKARGATRAQLVADKDNLSAELFYNALGWQTTQLGVRRRFIE